LSQDLIPRTENYNCETRIEELDEDRRTTLFGAAENGRLEVVKLLLEAGANVEARDEDGRTAVFCALESERFEVLKMLLDARADVEIEKRHGGAPLIMKVRKGPHGTKIAKLP
jgi:ankyrin repeat protein